LARAGAHATQTHRAYARQFDEALREAFTATDFSALPPGQVADNLLRTKKTVDFLKLANRSDALERKVLFNLCFMRKHLTEFDRSRAHLRHSGKNTTAIDEVHAEYRSFLAQLNDTMGLALR
ncbi:hypothetical protein IWQ60_007864, partial [Tieghemiomyces parasiticus]